jgi:hypothetical protein
MKSANGKAAMSIQEQPWSQTLSEAKEIDVQFNKDARTLEDSPKRVWLTYSRMGTTYWDVFVAGKPVCEVEFILDDTSMEGVARQIAMTLGPAK